MTLAVSEALKNPLSKIFQLWRLNLPGWRRLLVPARLTCKFLSHNGILKSQDRDIITHMVRIDRAAEVRDLAQSADHDPLHLDRCQNCVPGNFDRRLLSQ